MTDDIHSCSLYCDLPACIKRQRDEYRQGLIDAQSVQPTSAPEQRQQVYESLLRAASGQLRQWHQKYGQNGPSWLPLGSDVQLLETIDDWLNATPPEQTDADRKIMTLKNQLLELKLLVQRRPAMNMGLFDAYEKWNGECYLLDWMNAVDNATPQPAEGET